MALVSLLEREDVPEAVQQAYDNGAAQFGRVLYTWQAIAHRPEIFGAYLPYLRAVAGPGVLEQRTKELTAVEVTLINHCHYSASHRVRAARAAGVSDAELKALAEGDYSAFSDRDRMALELAAAMTDGPASTPPSDSPAGVDPGLLDRARTEFSEPELVELTLNISLWNALTRFHRVMGFEDDLEPVPEFMQTRLDHGR